MIPSYRDKRTRDFADGKRVKAFESFRFGAMKALRAGCPQGGIGRDRLLTVDDARNPIRRHAKDLAIAERDIGRMVRGLPRRKAA